MTDRVENGTGLETDSIDRKNWKMIEKLFLGGRHLSTIFVNNVPGIYIYIFALFSFFAKKTNRLFRVPYTAATSNGTTSTHIILNAGKNTILSEETAAVR